MKTLGVSILGDYIGALVSMRWALHISYNRYMKTLFKLVTLILFFTFLSLSYVKYQKTKEQLSDYQKRVEYSKSKEINSSNSKSKNDKEELEKSRVVKQSTTLPSLVPPGFRSKKTIPDANIRDFKSEEEFSLDATDLEVLYPLDTDDTDFTVSCYFQNMHSVKLVSCTTTSMNYGEYRDDEREILFSYSLNGDTFDSVMVVTPYSKKESLDSF
jgi:hypothetical protein